MAWRRSRARAGVWIQTGGDRVARMAGVGGVPKEVPEELREALGRFQGQLKILLRNHQVSMKKRRR